MVSVAIESLSTESTGIESKRIASKGTVSCGTESTAIESIASPMSGKRKCGTSAMMKIMTKSSRDMSVFLLTAAKLQIICRITPAFRAFNVNYYEISIETL
jgi:hypothetical protein